MHCLAFAFPSCTFISYLLYLSAFAFLSFLVRSLLHRLAFAWGTWGTGSPAGSTTRWRCTVAGDPEGGRTVDHAHLKLNGENPVSSLGAWLLNNYTFWLFSFVLPRNPSRFKKGWPKCAVAIYEKSSRDVCLWLFDDFLDFHIQPQHFMSFTLQSQRMALHNLTTCARNTKR